MAFFAYNVNANVYMMLAEVLESLKKVIPMVKLKDIAEACGVSVATVSRALNGLTPPETKRAAGILLKAKELGYYPNAAARTLKTSRSHNIGILYEDRMDHEYFSPLLNELRFAAENLGYDMTFIRRCSNSEEGDYLDRARRRNLDGVVVVQADFNSADVIRLAVSAIPTVMIDHAYESCDCVMNDNRGSVEKIVQAVWEKGHRRVAMIHGEDCTVTRERVAGFYKACAELGLRIPASYVRESRFHSPDICAESVKALIKENEIRPTCILCPDDFSCLGALRALNEMNIRVPQDMSLVGYDGIRMTQMGTPRLTTYRQDAGEVARAAASLLNEAINDPKAHQTRTVTVSGELIPGETLGLAP